MNIYPFRALRATPDAAEAIASPPYDVVDRAAARRLAEGNPRCFLRVSRPDLEFPDSVPPDDPAVYRRAAERLARFVAEGWLLRDASPSLFLYRLATARHAQHGIVCCCSVEEYERGVIRRHEHTRAAPEADRTRHTDAIDANAGPVWLAWDDGGAFAALRRPAEATEPLYDLTRPDGVRHTIWRFPDAEPLRRHFEAVPAAYIADGHHRAASAARVALARRAANPRRHGAEEYNRFLAALFPADEMRILPYNRLLLDLGARSRLEALAEIEKRFAVLPAEGPEPSAPGSIAFYLGGQWRRMTWPPMPSADPVAALEVSVLHDRLLEPVFGIRDPRTDPRLTFLGGTDSAARLAERVDRGEGAIAFSLPPVGIRRLMAVADAGRAMPPKSTWFEPKLLSGLLIHPLDSASGR